MYSKYNSEINITTNIFKIILKYSEHSPNIYASTIMYTYYNCTQKWEVVSAIANFIIFLNVLILNLYVVY